MAHTHLGRAVKNIEAPRPLKTQSRASLKNSYLVIEELIQLIDNVTVGLQSYNTTPESITLLLHNLRVHGPQLEAVSKDTLDRAFVVFRNASQDERLNILTRLKLLELIELRAKSWENDDTIAYYKSKQQVSNVEVSSGKGDYEKRKLIHLLLSSCPRRHISTMPAGSQAAFSAPPPHSVSAAVVLVVSTSA